MKNIEWKKNIPYLSLAIAYCVGMILYTVVSCFFSTKEMGQFDWTIPVMIGSIFIIVGSLTVVLIIVKKNVQIHNIYLVMSFVVLSVMLWTQTPLHHHDAQFHYDSTYVLSNMILGENTGTGIMGGRVEQYNRRECDRFMQYASFDNFIKAYEDIQIEMFTCPIVENRDFVITKTYQNYVSEPLYFYLPQALGFVMARLLHLNVYWLLFLGRLFLAVTSSVITWIAIKNTPVYKEIFLLCGLLPTTILSYVTVSRDALILAFSFYYTAKCIKLAYSQQKTDKKEYLFLFLSLLLLAPYKFVYIPFLVLIALIVYRKKKNANLGKNSLVVGIISVIVILGFFIIVNHDYIFRYLSGNNKSVLDEGMPFTILYILENPIHTLSIVGKTLLTSTVRYAANLIAIGDYGGGIHKEIVVVEGVFIIILLLQSDRMKRNNIEFTVSLVERVIMIITWVLISGMVFMAYLMLTPTTNDVIIGIQGRYFTPAFPLMLISFCSMGWTKRIKNQSWKSVIDYLDTKSVRQLVLLGIYGLSLFVAVNMFVWVVTYQ